MSKEHKQRQVCKALEADSTGLTNEARLLWIFRTMGSSVRQKSECASDMRWPNDIEVSPHESYLGSSECALRVYLGPLSSQGNRPSNFDYKQTEWIK